MLGAFSVAVIQVHICARLTLQPRKAWQVITQHPSLTQATGNPSKAFHKLTSVHHFFSFSLKPFLFVYLGGGIRFF